MWLTVEKAADLVRSGGLIGYPTEAVFGLGCDPLDEKAVETLLTVKKRPRSKGLILVAADIAQLQDWVIASESQWHRMQSCWPGAVTFLVPVTAKVPGWIRGDHDTLAIRIPGHPVARELARQCQSPIVSTSANRSGQPACRDADSLQAEMGDQLDGILDGECNMSDRPSTIIDLQTGAVIRP